MGAPKSLLFVVAIALVFELTTSQAPFVNPNVVVVQDFEGWGTSLAWWPDVLGHFDEVVIDEVVSAVFSPEKLNLNIVRYTIGGTTPGKYACGPYRTGSATESYLDGPTEEYDWTRDPRQRAILAKAKVLGVNIFEAFSNSPPQWMTISGCSKGNPLGGLLHANFDAENATAFADYATEVIKHFHEVWGITFTSYAPFNEPFGLAGLGGWFGPQTSQEGCNMARPVMAEVIRKVDAALQDKGMDYVTITAGDETQMNTETATQNFFRVNGVSNLISKVNTHGYWDVPGARRDLLSMASHRDGHKLWMDEMGWEQSPLNDMTQGLTVANRILVDLKKLMPSAWVYWQAVEGVGEWGLMSIPYDRQEASLDDIHYHSGYYSMMQFSKYVRQGYSILNVNDDSTLAALGGNKLVLVIVNNDKDRTVAKSFNLNLFASFGTLSATRTSPSEQNLVIQAPVIDAAKQLTYSAPPHSVTTIEIDNTVHQASGNLLANGDFETLGVWELEFGTTGGVSGTNAWRGTNSGYLESAESEIRLSQQVTVTKTGTCYLTAWCLAEGSGSKIGVLLGEMQGPALNIAKGVGYDAYALSFNVVDGDQITVYFHSAQEVGAGTAHIDEASLFCD